jgi:hypothetical protein
MPAAQKRAHLATSTDATTSENVETKGVRPSKVAHRLGMVLVCGGTRLVQCAQQRCKQSLMVLHAVQNRAGSRWSKRVTTAPAVR